MQNDNMKTNEQQIEQTTKCKATTNMNTTR